MERLHRDLMERIKDRVNNRYFVRGDDGTAIRVDSIDDAVASMGYTEARDTLGETIISTVFLGVNHQFGDGPPLLWETLALRPDRTLVVERYSTLADAVEGHRAAVAKLGAVNDAEGGDNATAD